MHLKILIIKNAIVIEVGFIVVLPCCLELKDRGRGQSMLYLGYHRHREIGSDSVGVRYGASRISATPTDADVVGCTMTHWILHSCL